MFEGIITALVTPFDENKNVDFDTFSMLIERQILLGVKNILILGSTGECESISQNDRIKMIKLAPVKSVLKNMVQIALCVMQASV